MLNREGSKCITCCLRKKASISILQEIKMDLSRGNEKAIGVFVSGSETKQHANSWAGFQRKSLVKWRESGPSARLKAKSYNFQGEKNFISF